MSEQREFYRVQIETRNRDGSLGHTAEQIIQEDGPDKGRMNEYCGHTISLAVGSLKRGRTKDVVEVLANALYWASLEYEREVPADKYGSHYRALQVDLVAAARAYIKNKNKAEQADRKTER